MLNGKDPSLEVTSLLAQQNVDAEASSNPFVVLEAQQLQAAASSEALMIDAENNKKQQIQPLIWNYDPAGVYLRTISLSM